MKNVWFCDSNEDRRCVNTNENTHIDCILLIVYTYSTCSSDYSSCCVGHKMFEINGWKMRKRMGHSGPVSKETFFWKT